MFMQTKTFVEAVNLMNSIIAHSGKAKKFSSDVEQGLKQKFIDLQRKLKDAESNQDFVPHAKAFQ